MRAPKRYVAGLIDLVVETLLAVFVVITLAIAAAHAVVVAGVILAKSNE
jgi:hypothetical protein